MFVESLDRVECLSDGNVLFVDAVRVYLRMRVNTVRVCVYIRTPHLTISEQPLYLQYIIGN
jgi:hypothetical protein